MIVERTDRGHLLLIPQTEHARICGVMARAWGGPEFEPPRPLESVALAAAEHDNGWAEWDAAPQLDPESGRPYSYRDIPIDQHMEIYRRGVARAVEMDLYAGVLVSLHGSLLYERFRAGQPRAAAFLEEQRELRARLIEALREDPATRALTDAAILRSNQALVFGLDTLSLFLCHGRPWSDRVEFPAGYGDARTSVRVRHRDRDWQLDPYPFRAAPLTLRVTARRLRGRRYADRAVFLEALESAAELQLDYHLNPLGH